VGSDDLKVYALSALNGNHIWNYTTGGAVASSPAVVSGVVYVGSYDGNVYALNASNGNLIWNYRTGDMVVSSPAAADGVVYVGSYDHLVYAFGPSPNEQKFTMTEFPWFAVLALIIVITLAAALIGAVAYRRKRRS
jgi:outer membrane protein assembly factor BamB